MPLKSPDFAWLIVVFPTTGAGEAYRRDTCPRQPCHTCVRFCAAVNCHGVILALPSRVLQLRHAGARFAEALIPFGVSLPMRSLLSIAGVSALMVAAALTSGCVFASVAPPRGLIYTDQKAPLFSGREAGSKTGRADAHCILFLVGWGDSGLRAAMQDGGITEVRHSDYRIQNYMLIYQKYTTIAYGE